MQKITLEQMQTRKKPRGRLLIFLGSLHRCTQCSRQLQKLNSYENENHNVHIQKVSSTLIVEIKIILALKIYFPFT